MEDKKNETVLEGKVIKCDTVLSSGRIYKRSAMEEAVKEFNQRIKNGEQVYGYLGYRESFACNIGEISHKVDNLSIKKDGTVFAEVSLLNTPNGQIVESMVKDTKLIEDGKLPLKPAIMAVGDINDNKEVINLDITTIDLVYNPKGNMKIKK